MTRHPFPKTPFPSPANVGPLLLQAMGTSGLQPVEIRAILHALKLANPPGLPAQRFVLMLEEKAVSIPDFVPPAALEMDEVCPVESMTCLDKPSSNAEISSVHPITSPSNSPSETLTVTHTQPRPPEVPRTRTSLPSLVSELTSKTVTIPASTDLLDVGIPPPLLPPQTAPFCSEAPPPLFDATSIPSISEKSGNSRPIASKAADTRSELLDALKSGCARQSLRRTHSAIASEIASAMENVNDASSLRTSAGEEASAGGEL